MQCPECNTPLREHITRARVEQKESCGCGRQVVASAICPNCHCESDFTLEPNLPEAA